MKEAPAVSSNGIHFSVHYVSLCGVLAVCITPVIGMAHDADRAG